MPPPPDSRQPARPDFADAPDARRRNMSAVRAKDTAPEMVLRRLLHAMGYRYRLHSRHLPGKPDIVLPGRRMVIDVRGCFWHRHPDTGCRNAVLPRTRADWWAAKLRRNIERDRANVEALEVAGWGVLVVWECEVRSDLAGLIEKLRDFLGPPPSRGECRPPCQADDILSP
jgi:DNA mismatch endonuclease Vsr